jgi:sulfur-oxidizing protein SoxY
MSSDAYRVSTAGRLIALLLFSLTSGSALAEAAPPDYRQQQSDKVWKEELRPAVFPDRTINTSKAEQYLELKAPYRAEDATVVPVSVHTKIPQSGDSYIKKIHMYVDKNPSPLVGVFEFTPQSGKADLALRIRVDAQSYVRAIAELNTGELYMVKNFVRATGACSAPPPPSIDDSYANMGRMRIRTFGDLALDEPNLVQLKIQHPNITGMQPMRIGSRVLPPPHFISEIDVAYDDQPVLKANLTFSVSMDPSFRFYFKPHRQGTLQIKAKDTKNNSWSSEYPVKG